MSRLTGVFQNETMSFDRETGKPKQFQAGSLYFKGAPSEDTRLDLWFPDNRRTEECVSAYASLYPLITYYLNRLNDWGLCFRRCKVCGKYFRQRASGMSCAATSAEKHRRFKTSGNLTRGQEKITMTCFIKMNARTGATK